MASGLGPRFRLRTDRFEKADFAGILGQRETGLSMLGDEVYSPGYMIRRFKFSSYELRPLTLLAIIRAVARTDQYGMPP